MALNIDVMDRLKAIRKKSQAFPHASADQRLDEIHDLSDLSKPYESPRNRMSATLPQRLADGAASRSPRRVSGKPPENAAKKAAEEKPEKPAKKTDEEEDPKKREKKGGRDRKEQGGRDRVAKSEDVNA